MARLFSLGRLDLSEIPPIIRMPELVREEELFP